MRVDFFLANKKIYTFERYATEELRNIFRGLGIKTRLIVIEEDPIMQYVRGVKEDPPTWTFSFSDLFLQKTPLCSLTGVPHFVWETTSLSHSLHTLDSPLGHLGYMDASIKGERLTFLPHGFASCFLEENREEKTFDVTIFNDLVDTEDLERTWKELFDAKTVCFLHEVVAHCLKYPLQHPLKTIYYRMKEGKIEGPANYFLFLVEEYLKASRSRALIESVEGKRVDVFGEHVGNNWLRRLKNAKNVYLHSSLPYTEYFEVLKRSKVLLRHQILAQEGSDEWVFPALAFGCQVVTNGSLYLKEVLNLPFYNTFEEIQERLLRPVENDGDLSAHTFEKRAMSLLEYFNAYASQECGI